VKKIKKPVWVLELWFSKFLKFSKDCLSNHRFLHENCQFFNVSEITGTDNSLILKSLKNQNCRLFKKIK
jgi:hypothetical protein